MDQLPALPHKGYGKLKEEKDITKRQETLNSYLQALLQRKDIFNSDVMRKFLQLENYAPETSIVPPKLVQQYRNFQMGIRDFIEIKDKST